MENKESTYGVSFSLTMLEISKLSDLIARTGQKRSILIREALNDLFAKYGKTEAEQLESDLRNADQTYKEWQGEPPYRGMTRDELTGKNIIVPEAVQP